MAAMPATAARARIPAGPGVGIHSRPGYARWWAGKAYRDSSHPVQDSRMIDAAPTVPTAIRSTAAEAGSAGALALSVQSFQAFGRTSAVSTMFVVYIRRA
jgi:hypothetical protein